MPSTWYVDLEGGNDSNDGSTYLLRRKSIAAVTAAQLAPGDTIRVMASKDPESLGINATFTNKSATVTLSGALNVLIHECDAAWTASANVTSTADTTVRRNGTGSAKHVIASGFTTGLASFVALGGAQNYSAYQGITLWVQVTAALAASTLSIRLCSDVAGVTTVDTLALPAITQSGQWIPVYIDKGSALGASIQSIALYADLDPGTITVYLDNISTTKAVGVDCLTLRSLIGKNTTGETFWGIRAISGTTVTLDNSPSMTVTGTGRGYSGVTATVAAYHRTPIATPLVAAAGTTVSTIAEAGSSVSVYNTVSGGWDRTNMSTQPGETWLDGSSGFGVGFLALAFIAIENMSFVRYATGVSFPSAASGAKVAVTGNTMHANNCSAGGFSLLPGLGTLTVGTIISAACCTNVGNFGIALTANIGPSTITSVTALSCGNSATAVVTGISFGASSFLSVGTLVSNNHTTVGCYVGNAAVVTCARFTSVTCNDNLNVGWSFLGTCQLNSMWIGTLVCNGNANGATLQDSYTYLDLVIDSISAASNGTAGVTIGAGASSVIKSLTTSGNAVTISNNVALTAPQYILKSSMAEVTVVSSVSGIASRRGCIVFRNFNGTAGDHRSYYGGATSARVDSEGTVRHTASGIAWKFSPTSTSWTSTLPLSKVVARVVCAASGLVTVKAWVRRTNTGLTASLVCPGGQIAGVPSDVVATISAIADTWEELTITFTPSETGTVEVEYQVYGGTTFSAYIDDMTISQA